MAAGLSMPTEHIAEFRRQINEFAASLPTDMPPQTIHLDCKLNPAALTVDMPKQIAYLEPFGTDNPSPVFGLLRHGAERNYTHRRRQSSAFAS